MKKSIFLILFFHLVTADAQSDWVKWEKADINYSNIHENFKKEYTIDGDTRSENVINLFASAYWFFISDIDGDNCPFRPSCSNFLVEAIHSTNMLQGVLMFFDRFTRDLNIFNRANKYPRADATHYYDPILLYTLDENKIQYLPPNAFFKTE